MAGNVRVRNSAVYLEKLQVIHRELGIPEGCSLGRRGPIFFPFGLLAFANPSLD